MYTPRKMRKAEFLERLEQGVIVGDGAMGTMLQKCGIEMPFEYASVSHPELVLEAHRAYVEAGAELIEANTYGANHVKLAPYAMAEQVEAINRASVRLAKEAAGGRAFVLGAIGPCGKPMVPIGMVSAAEARAAFVEQATILLDEGVDGIMLETFSDLAELQIAIEVVRSISSEVFIIAQKSFIEDGETIADGLPERFATAIAAMGVEVVGANCVVGPQRMLDIVRGLVCVEDIYVSAMPTPGLPQLVRGQLTYDTTPEYFARYVKRLVEAGVLVVGGCCGTTPDHIRAVHSAVQGVKPAKHTIAIRARGAMVDERPIPEATGSALSETLARGEYAITVELDLPRGVDMTKVLNGARSLKEKGVHAIDISDGARARLRMNPIAVAHLIQEQVGIEVVMHMACRDRNLLALQADLLGAHTLGIRNILGITGDPAQIGDYPTATSVFDLDSVGLTRILKRFNDGFDMAGNSIGIKANFTIAVAYDPLAQDLAQERDKLQRKVDAGAQLVYTQPIFEMTTVESASEAVARNGVPLLIGVLPLRSVRHAEFMHNEVPGIHIPDWLRARISEASEEDAPKVGIEVAQELVKQMRPLTQGAYLMPPFGNHAIAAAVMEALN